jgi:hypothetical protein
MRATNQIMHPKAFKDIAKVRLSNSYFLVQVERLKLQDSYLP